MGIDRLSRCAEMKPTPLPALVAINLPEMNKLMKNNTFKVVCERSEAGEISMIRMG
jgi:hypothetical protein